MLRRAAAKPAIEVVADRDDDGVHSCQIPHGRAVQLVVVLVMA
jgi:hypothetical protein